MNYESIKNEFIKLKREELEYINEISIISRKKYGQKLKKLRFIET